MAKTRVEFLTNESLKPAKMNLEPSPEDRCSKVLRNYGVILYNFIFQKAANFHDLYLYVHGDSKLLSGFPRPIIFKPKKKNEINLE
jgi:hypothetical protein